MDLIEKTLETKKIFQGKIIGLRVDTVQLPDGRTSTREVVEHNGGVAVVPMLDRETVILVRQFRQAAGRVLLEIPAGTLEVGEDPAECARRELIEEAGYIPGKLTKMFYSYLAPGYSSEKLHTYLAEDLSKDVQNTDSDEFIEIVTLSLEEALALIVSGEIVDSKTICGLLLASRMAGSKSI